MRVAIIGAGIGGLSLALALQERGIEAEVFEQAAELTEIGAAIALSANSIREYTRLGLTDSLAVNSTIPTELIYRQWRSGDRIAAHPVAKDGWYEKRFGAPYFGIHRADLQKTLSAAMPADRLHLGCRLVNLVQEPDSVVLEFANGRVERADIVVGADGVRSTVRRWITGSDDAVYSGTSAFRGIVPTANLTALPDPHAIQFWMGPDAHMLHYAIGGRGEAVNFFAVVETPQHLAARRLAPPSATRPPSVVPRLAPGDHRDDPGGGEPALLGAVHRAAAPALVRRARGDLGRRRARHAPAPRPRRQHLDRGRVRAGRVARRGAGNRGRCSSGSRSCAGPVPAPSSGARG